MHDKLIRRQVLLQEKQIIEANILLAYLTLHTLECRDEIWHQKTRIVGYQMTYKSYDASFLRFDTIPACDGRTDTQNISIAYLTLQIM